MERVILLSDEFILNKKKNPGIVFVLLMKYLLSADYQIS